MRARAKEAVLEGSTSEGLGVQGKQGLRLQWQELNTHKTSPTNTRMQRYQTESWAMSWCLPHVTTGDEKH